MTALEHYADQISQELQSDPNNQELRHDLEATLGLIKRQPHKQPSRLAGLTVTELDIIREGLCEVPDVTAGELFDEITTELRGRL